MPKAPAPKEVLIQPAYSRALLWLLVLVLAGWLLAHIKTTLTIFGLAFFIAYLLNSVVSYLEEHRHIKRVRAIMLVYVVLFGTLLVATALFVPLMISQVDGMVAQLPGLSARLTALGDTVRDNYLTRIPPEYQERLTASMAGGATYAAGAVKFLFEHLQAFVLGLVSGTFLLLTGLIVSFFVIMRWGELGEGLLTTLPRRYRKEVRNLGMDLHKIFGGYMKATITLASAVGVFTLLLLFVHGLFMGSNPYILVISCVAALCFPIPVVNQIIPPLLGGALAFISSNNSGYAVQVAVIVYLVNAVIERTVAPRIMSEAVGVSALFVLFAAFAGAELLGPIGALLGVPLAAMAKSVFVWFHARFLASEEEEGDGEEVSAIVLTPPIALPVEATPSAVTPTEPVAETPPTPTA